MWVVDLGEDGHKPWLLMHHIRLEPLLNIKTKNWFYEEDLESVISCAVEDGFIACDCPGWYCSEALIYPTQVSIFMLLSEGITYQYVKFQYQISIKNGKVLKKRDRRTKRKFGALRVGRSLCGSRAGFRGGESTYLWPFSTSSEDSLYETWVSRLLLMRHPAVKARIMTVTRG